jgi:hypothetical protein
MSHLQNSWRFRGARHILSRCAGARGIDGEDRASGGGLPRFSAQLRRAVVVGIDFSGGEPDEFKSAAA